MEGWARISGAPRSKGGSWIQGGGLVAHVARAVAWSVDGDPVTAAGAGVASPSPESRRGVAVWRVGATPFRFEK